MTSKGPKNANYFYWLDGKCIECSVFDRNVGKYHVWRLILKV
jgi:hypothetical protein